MNSRLLALMVALAALLCGAPDARSADWQASGLQDAGSYSGGPSVAVAPDGTAVAVWDAYGDVVASTRPAGGTWSAPAPLGPGATIGSPALPAGEPQVVVDQFGHATVVWLSGNGFTTPMQLLTASRPAGGTWGPATPLDSADVGLFPALVTRPDGTVVAAWVRAGATGAKTLQTASKPVGGAWSIAQPLYEHPTDVAYALALTAAATGEVTAAWTSAHGGESRVRSSAGVWSAASALPDDAGYETPVFADGTGQGLVWSSWDGEKTTVRVASRPTGQPWGPSVPLFEVPADHWISRLAVDQDASGGLIAVWGVEGDEASSGSVHAAARPSGGAWSAPVVISSGAGNTDPAVAVAPSGSAVATWKQAGRIAREGDDDEYAQRVVAAARVGGVWSAPRPASALIARGIASMDLAVNASGFAAAAYNFRTGFDLSAGAGAAVNPEVFAVPAALDTTAPTITIAAPADQQSFTVGSELTPQFACHDEPGGSGVASCAITEAFHTRSPGAFRFTVTATDAAGNRATKSVGYLVRAADPVGTPVPGADPVATVAPSPGSDPKPVPTVIPKASGSVTAKQIARSRSLAITVKNVPNGAKLTVAFKPRSGRPTKRAATVKNGKATVKPPTRKGTYTLTITYQGTTLVKRRLKVT